MLHWNLMLVSVNDAQHSAEGASLFRPTYRRKFDVPTTSEQVGVSRANPNTSLKLTPIFGNTILMLGFVPHPGLRDTA